MSTKTDFDLTPYRTAPKRAGWVVALIWVAVLTLCGIIGLLTGGIVVYAFGFTGAAVAALIALIAYLVSRR